MITKYAQFKKYLFCAHILFNEYELIANQIVLFRAKNINFGEHIVYFVTAK